MRCPRCQHENPPAAKFCLECGSRLAPTCVQCGTGLPAGAKFCLECGKPVGASPEQTPSPAAYTPKHLAEKILTSKATLEGERKQVTVLFADLKGSMELLADRDPEEARKLLDPVLERMMEAVHRYEGTVNQVMGDGIMALFGAPVAHEDHAVRACYAALDMQGAIRRYADEVWRTDGITVKIRVGLNSGEVVVRAISNDLRVDYTAVGQTTHLAARMEQLATPGTVLLTADTLRLAEGYVTAKPLGPVPVKGLEAPMEVYELTGAGPLRSRLHAAAVRGLTRFVGRGGELDHLRQALSRAAAGHGQVVAIVGEPGVGKSRLVWEVTHSYRVHGWLVLQAGSVSYGKATSYLPVIDLLKGYFAVEDRDGPRVVQEKVTGKLLTLDRALEGHLPALLSLLDVPIDDPQWPTLDPAHRRRRTLDAVTRLLLRESQVRPLLVVFEDLHWIDAETQAVLDALVEGLPAARLFLLVNYRPEYRPPWGSRTSYTQLRLDPLTPDHAEELLAALLGADAALEPLTRTLIARTEGNPFFLEESVRTLVETGALAGERGAYRLTRPLPGVQVPATVQAVLAARIDRLRPEDKTLLQTASVIGKDVPLPLLRAIVEPTTADLDAAIGRLQGAEFLYEASLFPDPEYTFKHALTHDVAYGSLLQDRRRALHARIMATIERLYADRLAEHVERLAHHAFRGDLWEKAVTYLRQAGVKALARSANRDARAYFEQALAALGHLPETRETREHAVDIRFDLRWALFPLAEFRTIDRYLQEAESLTRSLDDPRRLGWVLGHRCSHLMVMRAPLADMRPCAEQIQAISEALADVPLQVAAQYYQAHIDYMSGDYDAAEATCRSLMQRLQGERTGERFGLWQFPGVLSRAILARTLAERGLFEEGEAYGRDAIGIAEALEQPFSLIEACLALAYLHSVRGDLSPAIHLLERAVALSGDDITIFGPNAMASLGHAYMVSGRVGEGMSWLRRGLAGQDSVGIGYLHAVSLIQAGEGYLLAEQVAEARAAADRALRFSRERGERGHEAWALRLLGEVGTQADPPDLTPVEAHYGEALALATELGMRPLVAHCHLGLRKLYRRTGEHAKAKEHLTTATTMYREMGMTYWLEKAEAEHRGAQS